ncbi:NAD(P)/FAD-dependent oxidoreductase [Agromyces sp. Soil535]|uniref:NAD(P)/FAD-dependent oxidoreductase n=1 Tax=Agromyces sp. Soil535 TaxID=1736390 RepID=UPI0006FA2F26|nr:FAD-dependent oxidoreductase [Agromyces sp. Soil535]KRE22291.1 pyridine nucleotide-disulfide oxidoreductase [Agromyces sp. Soil535]
MSATNAATRYDALIIGAGHAGAQAAISLRQVGFAGTIGLIGDEPVAPYERPALSKEYLAGDKSFDQLLIRPDEFWTENSVELVSGERAVGVDPSAKTVTFESGAIVGYGSLVWATGGVPRRIPVPGGDLEGVLAIRSKADCDRLIEALPSIRNVVVIGGGFIGLESAAVLRARGATVTVVEALDRVLARVTAEPVSRFFENEHRAHGVELLLGVGIDSIEGDDASVTGVRLSDGRVLPADRVIVGIGIVPAIEPLIAAGAEVTPHATGVLIDELCRTSLADVYCVGDCSVLRNGPGMRIESRQNAHELATTAAKAITGITDPLVLVPWFWSHQYDLRLQTIGLNVGYDQTVLRGTPEERSFSLIYLKEGEVIALDCINATKDYVQGRRLVERRARVEPNVLADTDTALKDIAAAH